MCHNEKKVPDEWQAGQAIPAILQVSSSKLNANKKEEVRFIGRSLSSLQEKQREAVTNPTHVAVYVCQRKTKDSVYVCLCVYVCVCVRVCVCVYIPVVELESEQICDEEV